MTQDAKDVVRFILSAIASAVVSFSANLFFNDNPAKLVFIVAVLAMIVIYFGVSMVSSRQLGKTKSEMRLVFDDKLDKGGDALLQLLQPARDKSVRYMKGLSSNYAPPKTLINGVIGPDPRLEANRHLIRQMLEALVDIFREIAPQKANVWASLRDIRSDHHYHTFERAGHFSKARASTSEPLHKKNSPIVEALRASYVAKKCVILTGSTDSPTVWVNSKNDRFMENKCVLMGAVMTKSAAGSLGSDEWDKWRLTWIVSVNSDIENAFNHNHVNIMRNCIVAFSWLANTIIRVDPTVDLTPVDDI